ncbi:MAG: cell division/cell wall cluster transcriptional repressor MraZ [Rhodobacteraceae bacterium]|nr:cell division/cell wall cluster transcriptional repressor MraZ [Paracoccaceae bacterium]
MSVPADFRGVLEANDPKWAIGLSATMILQYSDDLTDHLRVWSVEEITKIRERIRKMPAGRNKNAMSYFYFTQTSPISVDKDGRIVLPLRFREKLGLGEGELTFLGYGDYFELWKSETFAATKSLDIASWLAEQEEGFDSLSLLEPAPPE